MIARLERLETSDHGTFGRFTANGIVLYSGELPDRANAANVSCIPSGKYPCAMTFSPRFKRRMYLVGNVPGRAGVRFHAANLMGDASKGLKSQLNGCIALSERIGTMDGQKALILSAPAIRKLEEVMDGKPFELEIIDA